MLCDVCVKTLHVQTSQRRPSPLTVSKDTWGATPIEHHPDPASLRHAVDFGCYICRIFFHEHKTALLNGKYSQVQPGKSSYTLIYPHYAINGRWSLFVRIHTVTKSVFVENAPSSTYELFVVQEKVQASGFLQLMQRNVFTPADIRPLGNLPNAGIDLARSWLQNCLQTHNVCTPNFPATDFVPTRLIDVSFNGNTSQWRLHITSPSEPVPYLTLSHCWGTTQTLRLLEDNLSSFTTGMSDSDVPIKYKNAFHVTRSLGHRYIWVDSLCIIQDSPSDWLKESMTMHSIYASSILTLAASNAPNSDTPFLHQRTPSLTLAEVITMNWQVAPSDSALSFLSSPPKSGNTRYLINHHDFYRMSLSRSPLASRAWCFQELALSPRVLHFEAEQLFWECRSLKSCEAHPFITMPSVTDLVSPVISDLFRGMTEAEAPRLMIMRPTSHWHDIIESYTKGGLTKGEDKFIALAGVAKAYEEKFGGEYVAGLWRSEMPYSLLWWVDGSKFEVRKFAEEGRELRFARRVSGYRAPSWSWGSMDGRVRYQLAPLLESGKPVFGVQKPRSDDISVDLVEVVDVSVTTFPVGNPFGQVTGGYIDLMGVLVRATPLSTISTTLDFPKTDREEVTLEVDSSVDLVTISYLPITFARGWVYGLLLCPASREGEEAYLRVGRFTFGSESCELLGIDTSQLRFRWPQGALSPRRVRIY
ncbi:heterokaryon incompatibility protein-domain-containing protein [Leptodontidium sp. MPI-SDFR-AT-0119]|nr:heterokaryon incompatibility protein-domain-containing protein [Leptodontidium sp. MPI-SDFR-AT-0119]